MLCYKRQRKYVIWNELPGAIRLVGFFFFFPFSKFLSLDSFFRVRLSVMVRFRVSVRVRLGFDPSSPIVRELVLSLTRLSFPLVRFRHNLIAGELAASTCTMYNW